MCIPSTLCIKCQSYLIPDRATVSNVGEFDKISIYIFCMRVCFTAARQPYGIFGKTRNMDLRSSLTITEMALVSVLLNQNCLMWDKINCVRLTVAFVDWCLEWRVIQQKWMSGTSILLSNLCINIRRYHFAIIVKLHRSIIKWCKADIIQWYSWLITMVLNSGQQFILCVIMFWEYFNVSS